MEAEGIDPTIKSLAFALLFVVLESNPRSLGMSELIETMVSEDPRRREDEETAIKRVVPRLEADGLLRQEDGRIAATPAAVRFSELSELIA